MSSIKALPTEKEIADRGCNDAGQYVLLMLAEENTRKEYEEMLMRRRVGWGGKPMQPLHICVRHTLWIMVRTIEAASQQGKIGTDQSNGELSMVEVNTWLTGAFAKQG